MEGPTYCHSIPTWYVTCHAIQTSECHGGMMLIFICIRIYTAKSFLFFFIYALQREDHPNDVESDVVSQHDALPTEAEEREEHHVDDNDSVTPVDAAPHSPKTPQTTTAEAAHSAAEKLNQTLKVKSISIRSRTEFQKYKMLAGSARPPRVEQPPTPISSTYVT